MNTPIDGSILTLPDLNPDVHLHKNQLDAIAQNLLSTRSRNNRHTGNRIIAHGVGTGKTYIICVTAHELKRRGLSRKNLIIVPNNVLKATADAHRYLYPKDNILVVYPKDFKPNKRNDVLADIRDNDYTCILMAYSTFDMIIMSKNYWIRKGLREISELRDAAANSTSQKEERALKAAAEKKQKALSKFAVSAEDTPLIPFEDLGISTLFVDEAHNYKNIPIRSHTDNIVGMHNAGSKKCREMYEKCQNVDRLIFATGTPLTNSLSDLFVLQSYLQPEELKYLGIDSFDMWINTFGERETAPEVDSIGNGLREMTRFSSFHNLPELMNLFSSVCDFYTDNDNTGIPLFRGYENVMVPRNVAQVKYIRALADQTEAVHSHEVDRSEDNLLKITTDGRKCALDVRLVDMDAAGIPYLDINTAKSKITACAERIMELYRRYPDCCQIVFSDIGTPKSRFNVYDSLRWELEMSGIPAYEIAYVHDAVSETARAKMFADMNKGKLRVVIGSTAKLGIGVNVQERLVALHHLSVPWRPSDMVQREGRILRPGNTCSEVFIFRYITEGTFDSYSWQLLENKQRFVSSFLSGTSASREQEDIADVVLTYAEVKALAIGDPLIKKRVETANLLERTRIISRQRQQQLVRLRAVVENTPERIKKLKAQCSEVRLDAAYYASTKAVIPKEERLAFGEELLDALGSNGLLEEERLFDTYQGFEIILPANMLSTRPYILVRHEGGGSYYVDMEAAKPLGCAMRIDHLLDGLPERAGSLEVDIQEAREQCDEAMRELDLGNPHQAEIEQLTEQLELIDAQLTSRENEVET